MRSICQTDCVCLSSMDTESSNAKGTRSPRTSKLEQEKISSVVKNLHRKLRRKYHDVGDFDKVWQEHCEDELTLREYAVAMKNLADNYWSKNCEGQVRVEWCRTVCRDYFLDGGMNRIVLKDEKRATHASFGVNALSYLRLRIPAHSGRILLLDVGSCFNPFLNFEELLTVGIDIVPAVESVYKCDFLNLQVQKPLQNLAPDAAEVFIRNIQSPIETLPSHLFHVVVFSLLLSYFPCPHQRWLCCKKAHELLRPYGLLLIVTPDSSHQNRHAPMMRSWRKAIESLGFHRFKYVKSSHLHLLAFRKVHTMSNSSFESSSYPEMLHIPQDFQTTDLDEPVRESPLRSDQEDCQLALDFLEMPNILDSDSE